MGGYLASRLRFLAGLPGHLRSRLTPEAAKERLHARLPGRGEALVTLLR